MSCFLIEFLLWQETVIQGYVPRGRIELFLPHLKAGSLYQLNNFFSTSSKPIYGVAEPGVTISFSWNSVLSLLEEGSVRIHEDRFRIHGYKEFEAACDLKGDLFGKFSPSRDLITVVFRFDFVFYQYCLAHRYIEH